MTNTKETILKSLPLVEVEYSDDKKSATLTFLDKEQGEIRQITMHTQGYDNDKNQYVDDPEQEKKIEERCQKYLSVGFADLEKALNSEHDIYVYEKFCSLYHVDLIEPFDKKEKGKIYNTKITEILDNGIMIQIRYQIDGATHQTKWNYSKYFEDLNKYMPNPNERAKKLTRFKDTFGVPFEQKDTLVGKPIMVEVKIAFGKFPYGEIKKMN